MTILFVTAPTGERMVLVEPMGDGRSNEVRHTFYERAEGEVKFSQKYCLAVSLRTIQGTIGDFPRFDTGEHRTATELPKALPVVYASEVDPWPIKPRECGLDDEIERLRAGHAESARRFRLLAKITSMPNLAIEDAERCEGLAEGLK